MQRRILTRTMIQCTARFLPDELFYVQQDPYLDNDFMYRRIITWAKISCTAWSFPGQSFHVQWALYLNYEAMNIRKCTWTMKPRREGCHGLCTMNIRILTWTMIPFTVGFVPELWNHEYKKVYLDYDAMNSRIFIEQFNFSQQLLLYKNIASHITAIKSQQQELVICNHQRG